MEDQKLALKNLAFFAQFTLQTALPLIALISLSVWLNSRFHMGYWIIIIAIVLGVLYIPYSLIALYIKHNKKQENKPKLKQFNKHI